MPLSMNRILSIVRVVIALILSLAVAPPVLAQGDITLVSYTSDDMAITGVVPEGWLEVAPGAYARNNSRTDLTLIIQQAARGVSGDEIAAVLLPRLGLEELPEEASARESETLAWTLYTVAIDVPNLGTVQVDLALSETESTTYLILLQALSDDYEALHQAVFLPAVDALAPIHYAWGPEEPEVAPETVEAAQLVPEVLAVRDHDPSAYTQGLVFDQGQFYESTGLRGESSLRLVDPQSGDVLRRIDIEPPYFAEGLALVGDRLIQLTWQENVAFVYDRDTFEQVGTYDYEGEGWGLCYDGQYLYMSDGTPVIDIRDPETFEVLYRGQVLLSGVPVPRLNELECVGDYLYANVWQADMILQIDKSNGAVTAMIDAAGLLTEEETAALPNQQQDVLNGIAYDPENDRFYITGKRWPHVFEVRFVAAPEEAAGSE